MTRLIRRGRSLFFRFPMILGIVVMVVLVVCSILFTELQSARIRSSYRDIINDASSIAALLAFRPNSHLTPPGKKIPGPGHPERFVSRISYLGRKGRLGWTIAFSERHDTLFRVEVPVSNAAGKNGVLLFDYSPVYLEKTISRMRFLFPLIMFVFLMIVLVLVHFLLVRLVRRPLEILMTATESIARGDFSRNVRLPVRDELALLGADITAMSRRLKRSFNEIEEKNREIGRYSEHLEEMVTRRTRELNEANQELKRKQQQIEKEMEMSRRIQMGIIPSPGRQVVHANLKVAFHYEAMYSVGGDLVDVIRVGRNKYACLIADVSGHGVPSALIMSMAKVSFMTNCRWDRGPAEICSRVNREMFRLIGDQRYFISAYLGILDMETGEFVYTNAGHHPSIHFSSNGYNKLDSTGCLLGIWENSEFGEERLHLNAGDRILLYTDGIIEARNPRGELFGQERLIISGRSPGLSVGEFIERLVSELYVFCGGREANDDRALLYLQFNGTETISDY